MHCKRKISEGGSSIFLTSSGNDELEIIFADECWTEIEESRLGLIYNDLNLAGDRLVLKGESPFKVLLGKASSVEMIYNGASVDIAPYIALDDTAKLRLAD